MVSHSAAARPGATAVRSLAEVTDAASSYALHVMRGGRFVAHALPSDGYVRIGREPGSDIRIEDACVSRRHAVLRMDRGVALEDLGSQNGTFVAGTRLEPHRPTAIAMGPVRFGDALTVLVHDLPVTNSRALVSVETLRDLTDRLGARAAATGEQVAVLEVSNSGHVPLDSEHVKAALDQSLEGWHGIARIDAQSYRVVVANTTAAECDRRIPALSAILARRRGYGQCHITATYLPRPTGVAECAGVVVCDPAMHELYRLAHQLAAGMLSILITGETGVGKENMAETIHRNSPRASAPLVRVNCAALAETLLESELFGHEKGAFTGAAFSKPGLFETASGGTLFLDEVGELSPSAQAKLLRSLEQQAVTRVGGREALPVDVRFVAATNRDLSAAVVRGQFRRDLFYRIAGATIAIPPLRERPSEVLPLSLSFIDRVCRNLGRSRVPALSQDAREFLASHDWRGNVRELNNKIERAVLLCDGDTIEPAHLLEVTTCRRATGSAAAPPEAASDRASATSTPPPHPVASGAESERERIIRVLVECGGNQTKAAEALAISRSTLAKRLKRYGIPRPRA